MVDDSVLCIYWRDNGLLLLFRNSILSPVSQFDWCRWEWVLHWQDNGLLFLFPNNISHMDIEDVHSYFGTDGVVIISSSSSQHHHNDGEQQIGCWIGSFTRSEAQLFIGSCQNLIFRVLARLHVYSILDVMAFDGWSVVRSKIATLRFEGDSA